MSAVTTVLIVEDHDAVAQLLARLLRQQDQMEVAAVVDSGEAALDLLTRLHAGDGAASFPDLALVDVSLPAMNGIELVAKIRQTYPDLRCLMLSGHNDTSYVKRSLAAGAQGYVVKGDPFELLGAIRQVMTGELYLSAALK